MSSERGDLKVTPIYLCGDFNNPKSKRDLVKSAAHACKDYTLPEEAFVSAPSFGATRPRPCRKGRSRKTRSNRKKGAQMSRDEDGARSIVVDIRCGRGGRTTLHGIGSRDRGVPDRLATFSTTVPCARRTIRADSARRPRRERRRK
jgi:hypothetical protein